jgi:hypothetical protein
LKKQSSKKAKGKGKSKKVKGKIDMVFPVAKPMGETKLD